MSDLKAQLNGLKKELEAARDAKGLNDASEAFEDVSPSKMDFTAANAPKLKKSLKGHYGKVYAMHWAGDSNRLVSASQDGKLIVWVASTANKTQAVPLRSSWVMTCAYEQTGNQMVACGGLDNICSIYNLRGEGVSVSRAEKELSGHDGYLSECRFIDSQKIITCSGDSTCIMWDVSKGEAIRTFTDHGGDVMSVAIHPNNPQMFVSGSCDSHAKIWDTRTGNCVMTFSGHESDINSVAFFPDGNAIGTGSDDSSCRLFDLRAYCEVNQYCNERILCGITSMDFSSSGRILFAGYDDFDTRAWDTTGTEGSGRVMLLQAGRAYNHSHENRVSCLGVNPLGDALCTGSWDTQLNVWA